MTPPETAVGETEALEPLSRLFRFLRAATTVGDESGFDTPEATAAAKQRRVKVR